MSRVGQSGRNRRPTLRDVAASAGVSRATVSLALQDSSRVAEPTRRRVADAADRLGYVYNRSAAGLRTARTQTVGLVVDELADPFLAGLVAEIDQALGRYGRTAFLCNAGGSITRQDRVVRSMREYNAEGLMMVRPVAGTRSETLASLRQAGMPAIQVWSTIAGAALDAVLPDDRAGVDQAIAHLLRHGHREIAYLGGSPLDARCQVRLDALVRALEGAGRPPPPPHRRMVGPPTRAYGMLALYELLDADPAVSAVLCHSDEVAFGAMLALINGGRRPGRDMAIIGWNDVAEAALWVPGLTTIAHDTRLIAETAARRLIDRVSGDDAPPRTIRLKPSLVVRRSCGSPPTGGDATSQP